MKRGDDILGSYNSTYFFLKLFHFSEFAPPPPPPQPNGAAAAVKLNFDEYDVPCMLQYTANKVTNIVVH